MTLDEKSLASLCHAQGFAEGRVYEREHATTLSIRTTVAIVGWRQRLTVAWSMLAAGGRFTINGPHTVERKP